MRSFVPAILGPALDPHTFPIRLQCMTPDDDDDDDDDDGDDDDDDDDDKKTWKQTQTNAAD